MLSAYISLVQLELKSISAELITHKLHEKMKSEQAVLPNPCLEEEEEEEEDDDLQNVSFPR
jgi:hypothetical protein